MRALLDENMPKALVHLWRQHPRYGRCALAWKPGAFSRWAVTTKETGLV